MSGWAANVWATPSRNNGWSSTIATWSVSGIRASRVPQWERRDSAGSSARRAVDTELTAQAFGPLTHAYEAKVRFRSLDDGWIEAGARIGDLYDEPVHEPGNRHRRHRTLGVPPGVVQRLLDNSVQSNLRSQRRLRGQIALHDLSCQTGASLVAAHDVLERLGNSQRT
jgi:hypothetical protein